MVFDLKHQKALAIITYVTGSISFIMLFRIIFEVLQDQKKWNQTYFCFIFVMSFFEYFTFDAFVLSTNMITRNTDGVFYFCGAITMCKSHGFLNEPIVIGPIHNSMLAIYYVLLIRHGIPKHRIDTEIKPHLHPTCWFLAFKMACILLRMRIFNSSGL